MNQRSPVRRTARLLTLLQREDGLTVSDISRRLELPYATCHRMLRTLADEAVVNRAVNKRYKLSDSR